MKGPIKGSDLLWIWSGAPWSWASIADDGSPAHDVHQFFRRYNWRQHGLVAHVFMGAVFVAGVPVVLGMIALLTALYGGRVRRQEHKGRARQAGEQIALWLTQGVLPLSYYIFELHRGATRLRALEYLYRQETKRGLYPVLRQRFASAETTEALRDKARFALRCLKHGVPAVAALFVVNSGEITRFDDGSAGLPRCDLFLKPLSGAGGRGAAVWNYLGDGLYQNADLGVLSARKLLDHLLAQSRHRAYVGRAYVTNHPHLAAVSSGALCTVRVVTCLDEHNEPEVTHAVLRMARTPGIVVDNFHAGGIAAPIDLASGIVGRATDLGLNRDTQWFDTHPLTGAPIVGRQIPMWESVLDVARRAHQAFADQVIVGWDVAVLDSGPQLIEGNKGPDLDIIQRTSREPIGNSRVGTLLVHHLRRVLDEEQRSADSSRHELNRPSHTHPDEHHEWPPLRAHA
jgi:hypothetical protein